MALHRTAFRSDSKGGMLFWKTRVRKEDRLFENEKNCGSPSFRRISLCYLGSKLRRIRFPTVFKLFLKKAGNQKKEHLKCNVVVVASHQLTLSRCWSMAIAAIRYQLRNGMRQRHHHIESKCREC